MTNLIYSHYRDIMNNKVFYQHPNLMRILGMHETVMEVMVNVLGEGESKVRNALNFYYHHIRNVKLVKLLLNLI